MPGKPCSSDTYYEPLHIEILHYDGYKVEFKWKKPEILHGEPSYEVTWYCDGHILEKSMVSDEHFMRILKPGSINSVIVHAVPSKVSNRITIHAVPLSPTNVEVTNDPNSPDQAFVVKFDNPDYRSKNFRVTWYDLDTSHPVPNDSDKKETQNRLFTIKHLRPGTNYVVYVQSLLSTECGSEQVLLESPKSISTIKQTYPEQIKEVKAKKTSPGSFCLSWDPVRSAVSYEIMIKKEDGNYECKKSTFPEIVCSDLERGSKFYAKAAAVNDAGRGTFSELVEFETDPDAPLNVKATLDEDNPTQLHVSFDEPQTKPHHYVIRLNDEEGIKTFKNEVTLPVELGQIYCVSVQSMNEEKTRRSGVVYSESILTRPTKVSRPEVIHKKDASVTVKWSETATAHHYIVKLTGEDTSTFKTDDEEFTLSNLDPGQDFLIAVAAVNQSGQGKYSESLLFQTIPLSPHNIEVKNCQQSTSDSLLVSFKYPSVYEDAQFIIHAQALTNEEVTCTTAKRLEVIKGLVPGETYSLSVEALIDGRKSRKTEVSESIMTFPDKVKIKDVKLEDTSIVLEWEPLEIQPNEYKVFVKTQNEFSDFVVKQGTTFTMISVKPSTNYIFTVAAINDAGCGAISEEISHKTAPSPPVNVKVRNNLASPETSLIVEYEDPDPSEKSYTIYAIPSRDKEDRPVSQTKTSSSVAILTDLAPGESYRVYVVAEQWGLESRKAYFDN